MGISPGNIFQDFSRGILLGISSRDFNGRCYRDFFPGVSFEDSSSSSLLGFLQKFSPAPAIPSGDFFCGSAFWEFTQDLPLVISPGILFGDINRNALWESGDFNWSSFWEVLK